MRAVFGLVLVLGMGLAGFAVFMVKGYVGDQQSALERERARAAQTVETVEVYAVNRTIGYGELLTQDDVEAIKYPTAHLPEGVFKTIDALFPEGPDTPRVVLRAMEQNEPVLAIKVTAPGKDAGITSRLTRGMRAFTIKVDVSSGVSGFLRPGDRVDVYWTGRADFGRNESKGDITKLIEAGVKLIAIDQSAGGEVNEATIARTVTVAISPQQVAALAQAQSTGKLSLSLVGAEDDTIAEAINVDQRSLLGFEAQEAAAEVEKEKVCTIRTRRGAEVVDIPIPCTN